MAQIQSRAQVEVRSLPEMSNGHLRHQELHVLRVMRPAEVRYGEKCPLGMQRCSLVGHRACIGICSQVDGMGWDGIPYGVYCAGRSPVEMEIITAERSKQSDQVGARGRDRCASRH